MVMATSDNASLDEVIQGNINILAEHTRALAAKELLTPADRAEARSNLLALCAVRRVEIDARRARLLDDIPQDKLYRMICKEFGCSLQQLQSFLEGVQQRQIQ